jgi:hypothetical protein
MTERSGGMTRRHFLIVSAAFAAPLLVRRPWEMLDPLRIGSNATAERLAALLRRPDSARIIGQAFLRVSSERTTTALVSGIVASLPGGPRAIADSADEADVRELLVERIRRDFAEEVVVELDGWIVSRTEARLCGIVALG